MRIRLQLDKSSIRNYEKAVGGFDEAVKKGLVKAMLFAEGLAKAHYGDNGLHVRTGNLRRSITSGAKDFTGWIGTNVVYAPTHEYGATITPKRGKYLKFQIMGQWKSVRQVVIPKRQFLTPIFENREEEITKVLLDDIMESFK